MIFDLSSGRRKRVVQVVFGALAAVFALSFLFFGIGSDANGGLADLLGIGQNSNQDGDNPQFEDEIKEAQDKLDRDPTNEEALLDLTKTFVASGNSLFQEDKTDEAVEEYGKAYDTWNRYVELKPAKPDEATHVLVTNNVYPVIQQTKALESGDAFKDFIESLYASDLLYANFDPSVDNLQALAISAYLTGREKAAKAAETKALAKADSVRRPAISEAIKQAKRQRKQIEVFIKQSQAQKGDDDNPLEVPNIDLGGDGSAGGQTP